MLKDKKSKLFFIVLLLFLFMLGANFALAIEFRAPEINYPSLPFPGVKSPQVFLKEIQISGEQALPLYVKYFYYLFLMIVGLLALGVIIYGGFLYLISAGAPVKMIAAKDQITGGILGLVILLSSYLILATINPQLVILRLPGLEKVTLPEIKVPPLEKKVLTYFQIPTGKIIENAVLNEIGQQKMDYVKEMAEETRIAAEELKKLTEDLKKETDKCKCGITKCSAPPSCSGDSCPQSKCDTNKIEKIVEDIKDAIEVLKEKQEELMMAKNPLINDFSQLEAAGLLMSLKYWEVFPYNDLLSIKCDPEVEVEVTSFPDWEDIDIKMDGQIIKDPVTFYLDKFTNEQEIYLASVLRWAGDAGFPPEPIGGWAEDPPADPGKLNWPIAKWPGSFFGDCRGDNCERLHQGIDIFADRYTQIRAAAAGRIVKVENNPFSGAAGRMITIAHDEIGFSTKYMHNEQNLVKVGDRVEVGDPIATVGNSGNAITTKPHLHFEAWPCILYPRPASCRAADPLKYLPPLQ